MYSEPWARLMQCMRPNCRPLRACSRISWVMYGQGGGQGRPLQASLHLALRHVGIGVVGEDGTHGLVGDAAIGILADGAQDVVLHRIMVGVELEVATHGFEALGFERFLQRLLVLDPYMKEYPGKDFKGTLF